MSNKTDIEEDIKKIEVYLEQQDRKFVSEYRLKFLQAIENIISAYREKESKANKYDSLVEKMKDKIKLVDKIYETLLTDIGGIKIIDVSGLSRKEKEEVVNKRNCLIVQKATYKEILELLDTEK